MIALPDKPAADGVAKVRARPPSRVDLRAARPSRQHKLSCGCCGSRDRRAAPRTNATRLHAPLQASQPTTLAATMQASPGKRPPLQVPNAQPQAQQQQGSPGLPSKRRLAW